MYHPHPLSVAPANHQPAQKPLHNIDFTPILQFAIYTLVNVPINVLWQDWLESAFPSSKPAPAIAAAKEKQQVGTPAVGEQKKQLDVKNTLVKFGLDQTVGAAFNIPIFISTIGALKGLGWEAIVSNIQRVGCVLSVEDRGVSEMLTVIPRIFLIFILRVRNFGRRSR
jgi:hypothetical protein